MDGRPASTAGREPRPDRPWTGLVCSLVPALVYPITAVSVASGDGSNTFSWRQYLEAAPFWLIIICLPCALPLVAARPGAARLTVLVLVSGVAAVAGVAAANSDDAQVGLAVLMVPMIAIPLGLVVWIGEEAVAARRRRWMDIRSDGNSEQPAVPVVQPAAASTRLAAHVIDVVVFGAVLVVPLTRMSHAKHELAAAVVGVGVPILIMSVLLVTGRSTIGQRVLGLRVVDARSLGRVSVAQALVRSTVIVVLSVLGFTLLLAPLAILEMLVVLSSGRSLTDRLVRTNVVRGSSVCSDEPPLLHRP